MASLTENDGVVLHQIFDPESAPPQVVLVDESLPSLPLKQEAELQEEEKSIIRQVETALKLSLNDSKRSELLSNASRRLTCLLAAHPDSPSLLNDFAQLHRFRHGDHNIVSTPQHSIDQATADEAANTLRYLAKAIKLLSPSSPIMGISPTQARILSQAHMQRGAMYYAAAKDLPEGCIKNSTIMVTALQDWSRTDFEEAASRDFFMAGRYGDEMGRALAVHSNPTAKLCGQMVRDAMRIEYNPASISH